MKKHTFIKNTLLSLIILVLAFSCQLPKDKIINYSKKTGSITGFNCPQDIRVFGDYLFILDDDGLYMLNVLFTDLSGDRVTESDFLYENEDYSSLGLIQDFDVTGDDVYICSYNPDSSKFYLIKKTVYLEEVNHFYIPKAKSVTNIKVCGDNLLLVGNTNFAMKGINTKDTTGDIIFDTTADYIVAKDYKNFDNISVTPYKPIGKQKSNGTDIYLISMATDQCGIRYYEYNTDVSTDNILLKKTYKLNLYPFDIQLKKDDDTKMISSEQGRVAIYDLLSEKPYIKLDKTIDIGKENGALKTIQWQDKLLCLYGYKIEPNEYDNTSYEIYAYWGGIKVIEDPWTNPKVVKTITFDGWATDFAVWGDYIYVANQVTNCVDMFKLK